MEIHILDINAQPVSGSRVKANCGEEVIFHPIKENWMDPRICKICLKRHDNSQASSEHTFLIPKYKGG
jgi:hypothetical protein